MTDTPTSNTVSRRDFLKAAWMFLGGIAALETAGVFISYLQPRLAEGEFGSVIIPGKVDDFPPNSVTHIPNGRFYVVRTGDASGRNMSTTTPRSASVRMVTSSRMSGKGGVKGPMMNPASR